MTSLGRKSQVFGNPVGGSGLVFSPRCAVSSEVLQLHDSSLIASGYPCAFLLILPRHTLIPPRGYTIAGVSGSCAAWIDGFGIILTR
ncbi:hypothetical protein OCU04_007669 [Sclerotinia nivalis]|uniref:Uncharacterized protein n=1 Tax=Sclerotinia nivalis TaxID=352851 RepID=A0A9X0DIN3_9HELO|nr:hypothetical protein OCU04_007669 [Sclerotinia nivalis]